MLLKESNRTEKSGALQSYRVKGVNAINQLIAIKAQLILLKTTVNGDADFDASDETDVQTVINELAAGIASL